MFLSAEESIISTQQSKRYAEMKREAEQFLIEECDSLYSAIIRPGLVYHQSERPWSVPLGLFSNFSHSVTKGSGPPGTSLRVLADVTIREALKDRQQDDKRKDNEERHTIISAADMKTPFPL